MPNGWPPAPIADLLQNIRNLADTAYAQTSDPDLREKIAAAKSLAGFCQTTHDPASPPDYDQAQHEEMVRTANAAAEAGDWTIVTDELNHPGGDD